MILGAKFAIPVRELNRGAGQSLLDINLPAPDLDKAASIGLPLTVSLSEGPLQISGLDTFASGVSENRQGGMLPIIATMMGPVWQSIVIADQVAMKFNCLLNARASFPVILREFDVKTLCIQYFKFCRFQA
jgi:hypothetical protein